MKRLLFVVLCSLSVQLVAGSIRLYNDSPYKLRTVIRGADGTYLGEMVILPEHFSTWSDFYPSFGPGGRNSLQNPNRTMTPYTVHWFCLDGGEFGLTTNVATGSAVIAESSVGRRICNPKKDDDDERSSPYGPQEGDEVLHDQHQAEEELAE